MGRKKLDDNLKKVKLTVNISKENHQIIKDNNIKQSKLINYLLHQHFGLHNMNKS